MHPIPSGTRDVLPDEMRELRAITDRLRGAFEAKGYGEIATPALEYASTLERADVHGTTRPAYRLFDESGNVLALRSDMTVPIARVVATRFASAELPLRFFYLAHAYRSARSQGHPREFLQAGVELIGAPTPDGTVEVVSLLAAALDTAGLRSHRIGLGDASLYPTLLDGLEVPPAARPQILHELVTRDFVGLEREVRSLGLAADAAELLIGLPQLRGGPDVLDVPPGPVTDAVAGLRAVHDRVAPAVAERVIFDLGLARSLGYYTGAIFEVYAPALGSPIGGGGRYDDLLGVFGRPLPAVGFALAVDGLHAAVAREEGLT
jgi:ATP phosphoribosyltransferase regulatory subunit